MFFFSGSGFTDHAVGYAEEMGVALFTYDPTGTMTARNWAANDFLDRVEKGESGNSAEADDAGEQSGPRPPRPDLRPAWGRHTTNAAVKISEVMELEESKLGRAVIWAFVHGRGVLTTLTVFFAFYAIVSGISVALGESEFERMDVVRSVSLGVLSALGAAVWSKFQAPVADRL